MLYAIQNKKTGQFLNKFIKDEAEKVLWSNQKPEVQGGQFHDFDMECPEVYITRWVNLAKSYASELQELGHSVEVYNIAVF